MRTVFPLFLSAVRLCHRVLIGTAVLRCVLLGLGLWTLCASVLSFVEVDCRQFFPPAVFSLVSLVIPPPANAQLEAGRGLCSHRPVVQHPAVCVRSGQRVCCMCVFHLLFPFWGISLACALFFFSMMSWRTRLLSWVLCLCMHKSNLFMTIPHRRISPRLQRDLPPSARCIAISLGLLVVTLLDVNLEKVGYSVGLRMLRSPAGRALMH